MIVTATSTGIQGRHLISARTNQFVVDSGVNRGGLAQAPTPGEYLLAGVGACVVVVMEGEARRLGFAFERIEARTEASRGADGHSITAIRVDVSCRGMSADNARTLLDIYRGECPVYGIIDRGTDFSVHLAEIA